jgi:hypothetical protein
MIPKGNAYPCKGKNPIHIIKSQVQAGIHKSFPDSQYTDFYPLWFGTLALLTGQDPYSASVSHALRESWLVAQTHQVAAVVAYPLPCLVFLTPLAMLPLSWAGPLWFVLSVGLALTGLLLLTNEAYRERSQKQLFLVPLLSYPLFHAAVIKTSSVLALGIIVLMLWADCKRYRVFCGIITVLALFKPQMSLFFVGYTLLHQFRRDKLKIGAFLFGCLIFWGGTLLIQPGWVQVWLKVLKIYVRDSVNISLLPQGLVAVAVMFLLRAPALTQLALLQTVIFPVNDIYSTLPLIIGWLNLNSNYTALGVAMAWIAPVIYTSLNNLNTIWALIILPYVFFALYPKITLRLREWLARLGGAERTSNQS